MKLLNHFKLLRYIALISFIPLLGCDELEEFLKTEITASVSYTNTLTINVPNEASPDTSVRFRANGSFNFFNNAEVKNVIKEPEQIKKIEIQTIKYEYIDFSGNVDAQTVGSYFFIATGFMNGESFPVANEKIAEADLLGTRFNLSGDFSRVNDYITSNKIFSYLYEGEVSHNPAFFKVKVTITAKLTLEVNVEDEDT